jgi:hypothetical protein
LGDSFRLGVFFAIAVSSCQLLQVKGHILIERFFSLPPPFIKISLNLYSLLLPFVHLLLDNTIQLPHHIPVPINLLLRVFSPIFNHLAVGDELGVAFEELLGLGLLEIVEDLEILG